MGKRARFQKNFSVRDSDRNITVTPNDALVYPLRTGAIIKANDTLVDGLDIDTTVIHPGSLKSGDTVFWYSVASGSADTQALTLDGDPLYQPTTDDWLVTFSAVPSSISIVAGDRFVLNHDTVSHRVQAYKYREGVSGDPVYTYSASNNIVPVPSSGFVEFYAEVSDVDLYVKSVSGVFDPQYFFDAVVDAPREITPQMFGAVADNSTDDWAAIVKAISYARSQEGYAVHFPSGFYKVDTGTNGAIPITLESGSPSIKITGDGPESTRLLQDNDAGAGNNIIEIDGWNGSNTASLSMRDIGFGLSSGTSGHALQVKNASRCVFDNIYVFGLADGAGIYFDCDNDKKCDLNRVVNSYFGGNKYGIWNDVTATSGSGTKPYVDAQFIDNCIFGSNTSEDILFSNNSGLSDRGNGHFVSNCWIQGKASTNSGIVIQDDVNACTFVNVKIDGDGSSTYLSILSTAGWNFFDNFTVDGVIADASGNAHFGRVRNRPDGVSGFKWDGKRRAKETLASASTVTIKDNTEILFITGTTQVNLITDCQEGRRLDVVFTDAAPPQLGQALASVDDEIMLIIASPVRYKRYQLLGVADGTANRWYPSDSA